MAMMKLVLSRTRRWSNELKQPLNECQKAARFNGCNFNYTLDAISLHLLIPLCQMGELISVFVLHRLPSTHKAFNFSDVAAFKGDETWKALLMIDTDFVISSFLLLQFYFHVPATWDESFDDNL